MKYDVAEENILCILENSSYCVLATANKQGVVSADQMRIVNDGLKVYIPINKVFESIENVKENPNVCLHFGPFSCKGVANIVENPSDSRKFFQLVEQRRSEFNKYVNLSNAVLIEIELTECNMSGGLGYKANTKVDLKNKRMETIKF